MNLKPQQLPNHLQQGLSAAYLVSGDEFLLAEECCDLIRAHARKQEFSEREVYYPEKNFHWGEVLSSANSLSLFASRKIIELRCKSSKLDEESSAAILSLLEHPNPDTLLLLVTPKVEKTQQNSAWYKAIDKAGITITVWPVERSALPRWIEDRLRQHGLKATPDAIQFMADQLEGNLLAARQEIDKLRLLAGSDPIDLELVTRVICNASRYSVFSLTDRCLEGDLAAAMRTLAGLQAEGINAVPILAQLARELRNLHRIQASIAQGLPASQAMRNERVFDSRQPIMQKALQRLGLAAIEKLLRKARQVDQATKGMSKDSPSLLLEQLVTGFATRAG